MAAAWRQGKQMVLVHALLLLLPGRWPPQMSARCVCLRVLVALYEWSSKLCSS